MIKKYEIINDGGKKRIKALRSFSVQGRYVNIGDVGGIVYDENTLSQEGNGWIFSGNLGYPSIRVSGDSIVDTNGYEGAVTDPRPFVNITGTSALVGAHDFVTSALAARELAVSDVEQGRLNSVIIVGSTYEESKVVDPNAIRLKSLIYMGGISATVTLAGEGYQMQVLRYNAEKKLVSGSAMGNSASTDGAYYIGVQIRKNPAGPTVPADITAAKVTLSSTVIESTINIKDSRIVFNYTSAMTVATKVNPGYKGSVVRKSVIDTSNVVISKAGGTAFGARIYADIMQCNVAFKTVNAESTLAGTFENVKNLTYDGTFLGDYSLNLRKNLIVSGCDNFALSTGTITIPGINAANAANMPFIFTRCNVPSGRFYHNATIKNTYTDIDFAKASADLGKTVGNYYMSSSEVEGMYRLFTPDNTGSMLVEDYESVKNLKAAVAAYDTTIYKDAYFRGKFEFAGTNVFGNKVPGHPRAVELKARPRVVQGTLNTLVIGSTVTGVVPAKSAVVMPIKYRINSGEGISVKNIPEGIQAQIVAVTERNVIEGVSGAVTTSGNFSNYAGYTYAFINFSKIDYTPITPDELGDTTITVYNGCKIVNTGTAAINMKGNIRVEDNATLVNASVVGSGYFGGNSVTENANVVGSICVADNGVFAPAAEEGKFDSDIRIVDNAKFLAASRSMNNVMHMDGNSEFSGTIAVDTLSIVMHDRSKMAGRVSGRGLLILGDNADTSDKAIEANGCIHLVGSYRQTGAKIWTGNRTIGSESEPTYDNNVKTEYDF